MSLITSKVETSGFGRRRHFGTIRDILPASGVLELSLENKGARDFLVSSVHLTVRDLVGDYEAGDVDRAGSVWLSSVRGAPSNAFAHGWLRVGDSIFVELRNASAEALVVILCVFGHDDAR